MVKSLFKQIVKINWFLLVLTMTAQVYADFEAEKFIIEPISIEPINRAMTDGKNKKPTTLPVDYVLVKKAERKLFLYAGPDLVKTYTIALGKQPKGHKEKEGDSRTPEGIYILDWRNPHSKFYRSIHVSYPSISEARNAEEAGIDPGGAIMIHGQPNDWSERIKLTFAHKDWTEGCIALENHDMIEVWDLVKDGTPIEIKP